MDGAFFGENILGQNRLEANYMVLLNEIGSFEDFAPVNSVVVLVDCHLKMNVHLEAQFR